MDETIKQTINHTARECYDAIGLDYDAPELRIAPLFEMITAHPIFVKELAFDKRLTAELAVDCIRQEMGFAARNYLQKPNKLSGFIYAAQSAGSLFGCIFTETSEPTARRRFSAAYELAHYLLDFAPIAQGQEDKFLAFTEGISFTNDETDEEKKNEIRIVCDFSGEESRKLILGKEREDRADAFAAELLIPRVACLTLAENYGRKFGKNKNVVARRLATDFLVSFDAMNRRLQARAVRFTGSRLRSR